MVRFLVGQLRQVVLLEAVVDGVVLAELGLLAQHLRTPLSHLLLASNKSYIHHANSPPCSSARQRARSSLLRQIGQLRLPLHQASRHSWWNKCRQGVTRTRSSCVKSARQIEQLSSCLKVSCSFSSNYPALYWIAGMRISSSSMLLLWIGGFLMAALTRRE